jgi:uncharacterized protein YbjT (DUF2867 family)
MTVLVIGGTGTVGSRVVGALVKEGVDVRVLTRQPDKARLPDGARAVEGDLMKPDSLRAAMQGINTLFLLNAVAPDELTQALIALDLARSSKLKGIVYFSVFRAETYTGVPHFTGKLAAERCIEHAKLPTTVLRPAFFMENDARLKDVIISHGVYPMPIGDVGLAMVDVGDIADVAVFELLRRERSPDPLPQEMIELVGPEHMTGDNVAAIWSEVTGRTVRYGGDDLDAFERQMVTSIPGWMAFDMRMMCEAFQKHGMIAEPESVARLEQLLGRPLRRYRDFAESVVKAG